MKASSALKKLIILCFWLLLWQITASVAASSLLLPGPAETAVGLFRLAQKTDFYIDILHTVWRCVAAIFLALLFGTTLSLAAYKIAVVREALSLPVAFFKSVPIMAVAIYMIFLMTSGNVPILVCFIMCFPIVYTNLLQGLDSMNVEYTELAAAFDIPVLKTVRFIYLPQMYPFFKSALSLIAGMSWKAVVTAEILSVPDFSLGYELMNAKYYLNTDLLFAYVASIIAISVLFEHLVNYLLNRLDVMRQYSGCKVRGRGLRSAEGEQGFEVPEIIFDKVSKSYGGRPVIKDFSAEFPAGETTAITAPSGTGKTTLMRILLGLEEADSGRVTGGGGRTAVLFQEDRLLPWLNVRDNLAVIQDMPDDDRIGELLESVGLKKEKSLMPEQLSGGMKHRVAIARLALHDAPLIIADEPFRGLDDETRERVVKGLWRSCTAGRTVLLITHDPEIASRLAKSELSLA